MAPPEAASQQSGRLANFRLIPRIDTYPAVIAFVQTIPGKIVLLALFGLGLTRVADNWWPVTLWLTLITFLPDLRRLLVSAAALAFALHPASQTWNGIMTIVLVVGVGALLFQAVVRWPRSWYGRSPVLVLLSGYSALVIFLSYVPSTAKYYRFGWEFTYVLSTYVWFIGYSLFDAKMARHDGIGLQLGTYRPFWGSSNTPVAKGSAYLRRIEADDDHQLAVIQLKGLKLLAWSILITVFAKYFNYFVYGYLRIATFDQALFLSATRNPLPWYACWASLFANFFGGIILLAGWGHMIVACCRMAGFNALRNTYRPLSSRTVAEFFNRYYFYFKELLVEFFFYPTFLRFFKGHKKLRVIAAIFAAACFGNAFYHFGRDLIFIHDLGIAHALAGYQVYLFYCVVLASAISYSQLRERPARPAGFLRGQLLPSISVVLFYCVLDVFGSTQRNFPLSEHFRFLGHLFNLNL